MAGGTDGNIISYDASGDPVAIATGNDGQVLTSAGAGAPPVFEDAGGGGAWNLIATAVASSSASLTITGLDSTYDTYAVAWSDIISGEDSISFRLRVGDSGGIDSGGSDYKYHTNTFQSNSTSFAAQATTGADAIAIGNMGNNTGEGNGGLVYIHQPADGTMQPTISGTYCSIDDGGNTMAGCISGTRASVITLDRVQIYPHSGDISSGRLTVWGIAHA